MQNLNQGLVFRFKIRWNLNQSRYKRIVRHFIQGSLSQNIHLSASHLEWKKILEKV